ncbi:unnamed protein product, partial [Phaeothamnion confervicola]
NISVSALCTVALILRGVQQRSSSSPIFRELPKKVSRRIRGIANEEKSTLLWGSPQPRGTRTMSFLHAKDGSVGATPTPATGFSRRFRHSTVTSHERRIQVFQQLATGDEPEHTAGDVPPPRLLPTALSLGVAAIIPVETTATTRAFLRLP